MRFTVSRVMDMIERRLTTDVALAQAVVDISEVAWYSELDSGRQVNLVRIGMVIDALGRYLLDAGAMLYPVTARELLSEGALTSKERMVLGRWADDGLIEVASRVPDRAVEVADYTGLPLIAVRGYDAHAARFPWLRERPERCLWLRPRAGGAVLAAGDEPTITTTAAPAPVAVGKASIARPPSGDGATGDVPGGDGATGDVPGGDGATGDASGGDGATGDASGGDGAVAMFGTFRPRGAIRVSSTRIVDRRFVRTDPSGIGSSLLAREWRCPEQDCPAFGRYRRIGQPVPLMRDGVPVCPRHGLPVRDVGPRPASFPVAVVVDDLARRRFVVDGSRVVTVGRDPANPDDVSVTEWLHRAARSWIAPAHLRLQVRDDALTVTDLSDNGTVVWKRAAADDPGQSERLYRTEYRLGSWDTIELYTGVELVPGHRRRATTVRSGELGSVLTDAPTVVMRRPEFSG